MIHTQTEIDNLVELAIIQRAELKRLVESLPQLREHLSSEIERNLEEIEPAIRSELEQFVAARASDAHAQTSAALTAKIDELARSLETTTAARYSILMVEREKNERFAQLAEQKIAAAAAELPTNVKSIVLDELSRFPRANQIDQLRKEFAEPASLNPRGKWQIGETYNKLDLVSINGNSYIANETTSEKPSSTSDQWTLSASRGTGGAGGGVTSLTDLVAVPNNGELLIGNGSGFVESTLTAGTGISITNGSGSITVTATGGVAFQGSWNASTNTPTLTSSVGTTGFFYIVSVAGSTNLNGVTDWEVGDWAIFGTSTWTKVDNTDKVSSVFGRVGSVVGVSTDYSAVGITNTALGASNPSTVAATTISATSTISATGAVTGSNLSGTNTGDQTNITGNAGTATALQTARAINGVNFDGTSAITVTAAGSTLSDTVPIAKGGTGQITAQAALNALLPSQVGATGKNLQSDGTNVSFVADAGGTVTSVSVSTANGVSGTVATSTTTPAISLTLGAITPTSVAASGSVTGSNLSGTNTGDQTITLTGDVTGSGTGSFVTAIGSGVIVNADVNAAAAIAYSKLNLATSIVNADISASAAIVDTKLATISTASKVSNSATTATNANTASAIVARDASGNFSAGTISAALTGNASTATALATGRTIAITGDLAYTSPSFDGSGNVTAAGTLASVASAGTTGGSTAIPVVTINAKGLTTSITTAVVIAPASTLTGATLASGVTASSLTSLGTIANLAVTAGTISGTPSASTDIANKLYVDTVAQGLDAKASCVAATTADITLSGTQTIDGISVIAGNRVLVKNQTLSQNNGIYLCAAGAWTRTTDADTWDELTSAFTFIETGTVNADTGWVCTANAGGTLGTTALPWSQFSGAGSYTASTGLTLTGTAFSLTAPVTVALGGTNATSAGIAAFNNITGYTAAGATGTTSTNLVFSTSPTITSPTITGGALNGTLGATTPSSVAATTGTFSSTLGVTGVATLGNGAILGTPASGTLTNCTIPASALTGATLAAGVTASSLTSLGTIAALSAGTGTFSGNVGLTNGKLTIASAGNDYGVDLSGSSTNLTSISFVNSNASSIRWNWGIQGGTYATAGTMSLNLNGVGDAITVNGSTRSVSLPAGLNSTAIGATTPSTGAFSTLSASSTLDVGSTSTLHFTQLTNNDQSNCRLRFINTGSGGQTWDILGGTNGASNAGLGFLNGSTTYMQLTTAGAAVTGAVSASAANGTVSATSTTGTNSGGFIFNNTGGQYIFGVNNSAGSVYSSTPYSMVVYAPTGKVIENVIAGDIKTSVSSTGLAVTGDVSASGHLYGNGATSSTTNLPSAAGINSVNNGSTVAFNFGVSTTTTNTNLGNFFNGNGTVGSITVNASATAYNTSSDYRLKNITGALTDSGIFIDALKPKVGTWKVDGSKFVGFLAHEFAEVSPLSVSGEKDAVDADGKPVYQSMQASTSEVIANLVAELQSLRKRLSALEAK